MTTNCSKNSKRILNVTELHNVTCKFYNYPNEIDNNISANVTKMSSVNNSQLIEKEKQRNSLDFFGTKKANSENKCEESSVFTNCLTGNPTVENNLNASKSEDLQNTQNTPWFDGGKDANKATEEPAFSRSAYKPCNETDYFDSEDEYWESLKRKQIHIRFCHHCQGYHPLRDVRGKIPAMCKIYIVLIVLLLN